MGSYEEEYKKGLQRGLEGKETAESPVEDLNIFRTDDEKAARERGFQAGRAEHEFRKRAVNR